MFFIYLVSSLSNIFINSLFFVNDAATTDIYTLSLHDALPIFAVQRQHGRASLRHCVHVAPDDERSDEDRSEEHTSELQSLAYLVCRLLLEKKKQCDIRKPLSINLHQFPNRE